MRDHREHVCQRRPALRWQVHRLVGRSLLRVSHLQLERLLLVLGHSGCGAVKAARGTAALSPLLEELVVPIRAHLVSGDDLTRAVQRNIGAAAAGLLAGSALIPEAVAAGQLSIRSAYFEIGTGLVTLL